MHVELFTYGYIQRYTTDGATCGQIQYRISYHYLHEYKSLHSLEKSTVGPHRTEEWLLSILFPPTLYCYLILFNLSGTLGRVPSHPNIHKKSLPVAKPFPLHTHREVIRSHAWSLCEVPSGSAWLVFVGRTRRQLCL